MSKNKNTKMNCSCFETSRFLFMSKQNVIELKSFLGPNRTRRIKTCCQTSGSTCGGDKKKPFQLVSVNERPSGWPQQGHQFQTKARVLSLMGRCHSPRRRPDWTPEHFVCDRRAWLTKAAAQGNPVTLPPCAGHEAAARRPDNRLKMAFLNQTHKARGDKSQSSVKSN